MTEIPVSPNPLWLLLVGDDFSLADSLTERFRAGGREGRFDLVTDAAALERELKSSGHHAVLFQATSQWITADEALALVRRFVPDRPFVVLPAEVLEGPVFFKAMENAAHDATKQLARTNEWLAAAEKLTHIASWEYDVPTRHFEFSKEAYSIFGIEAGGPLVLDGEAVGQLTHPDDREGLREALIQQLKHGANAEPFEHRIVRPDGSERLLMERTIVEERESSGRALRIMGAVQDVTEQRMAEQAHLTAKRQHLRAQFLVGVSHELRTPLNAMMGFAQLLEASDQSTLTAKQREHIQNIREAGGRLTALLDDALNAPQTFAGTWTFKPERINPREVICRSVEQFVSVTKANGIGFSVDTEGVRDVGYWDENLLRVIVGNLVSNAVRYTVAGKITVRADCNLERLCVEVADTGVGIPVDEREAIFEEFYRGSAAENGGTHGSGLGLTIVRQLVDLHGGSVSVDSREGDGSAFVVQLPVVGAG